MKKFLKAVSLMFVCILSCFTIAGCGKAKMTGFTIKSGTFYPTVYVGEQLDTSNMVLVVNYDDDTQKEVNVSSDVTFSTIDTSKAGIQELTITYKGFSLKVEIFIDEVQLESIYVKDIEEGYTVVEGTELDLSNLVLLVNYNNGTTQEIAKNDEMTFDFTGVDFNVPGFYEFKISYKNKETKVNVQVVKKEITNISFVDSTLPDVIEQNNVLDLSGLKIIVYYNNNTTEEITKNDEFQISNFNTAKLGEQLLNVSYKGFTISKKITVVEKQEGTPVSLQVKPETGKRDYYTEDVLDLEELVVIVTYDDESSVPFKFNNLMTVTGANLNQSGKQTLTIEFKGLTAQFDINVTKLEVVEMSVVPGSILTQINVNDVFDTTNLKLHVTFNSGKIVDITKNEDVLLSNIDTSVAGVQKLMITYYDKTISQSITVAGINDVVVDEFSKPLTIANYETKSTDTNKDKATDNYMVASKTYKVGNDNTFYIEPTISAFKVDDTPVYTAKVACDYKVEIKKVSEDASKYAVLDDNELAKYVSIDALNYGFNFKDYAVKSLGNEVMFRITITPNGDYMGILDGFSFEVEVVDGYNVYDAKQLSAMDNNAKTKPMWEAFKKANNIPQNINPKSIVLHSDLTLTTDDIPQAYLYKKGDADIGSDTTLIGGLRERKSIYTIDTKETETFKFFGNYFTIDASNIPLVPKNGYKGNSMAHSALFGFGLDNHYCPTTNQGTNIVDSVKFVGNSQRIEDDKYAGGLYLFQSSSQYFKATNVVASGFLSQLNAMNNNANWENTHVIENCKFKDSYSLMTGFWGTKNVLIKDSILTGSGGPSIYCTHVNPNANPNSRWQSIKVQNSILEAHVNGSESWFAGNGAVPVATQIISMSPLMTLDSQNWKAQDSIAQAKSFAKEIGGTNKVNMKCLFMADNTINNTLPIKGEYVELDAQGQIVESYSMENPVYHGIMNAAAALKPIPFLQTKGFLGTFIVGADKAPNGIGKVDMTVPGGLAPLTAEDAKQFYQGNNVHLLVNGGAIGMIGELFDI